MWAAGLSPVIILPPPVLEQPQGSVSEKRSRGAWIDEKVLPGL